MNDDFSKKVALSQIKEKVMKDSSDVLTDLADMQADIAAEDEDDLCYHGGQSWDTSRFDFEVRDSLIVADVLDSPFPPCPEALDVLREQLIRCCQESPPTQCEELIETIASVRGVNAKHVAVSSGSSSLMFSFLPQLLNKDSKVLVLSPMYGEYSHILTHVIGCHMTNFILHQDDGFRINTDELVAQSRQHDAVILVNPNSPTGVYCEKMEDIVRRIQDESESPTLCKMIWVDETYIDYLPDAQSLERLTATTPNLIVCKSMSKCYALSGLRVAYAVSQQITELRRFIPPWAVSLPGQLAAVAALRNPEYYQQKYRIIHQQREELSRLLQQEAFTVLPGVANFILTFLPKKTQHTSASFIEACKEKGVFIRDAQNMGVTLSNNAVRFAIRSKKENTRMLQCVREVLS
jgi:histidinol-phosphate/aromatic aminotransferase/cobyric acid decarboxylase-like protein